MVNANMSEKCNANLKQVFNLLDALFIGKEQNNVIISLNHRVVVRLKQSRPWRMVTVAAPGWWGA